MSGWRLRLNGSPPRLVAWEAVDHLRARVHLASDGVQVEIERSLTALGVEDALTLTSGGRAADATVALEIECQFDFADIFEVRGLEPARSRAVEVGAGSSGSGDVLRARYANGSFERAVGVRAEQATSVTMGRAGALIRFDGSVSRDHAWRTLISWQPRAATIRTAPRQHDSREPRLEVRTSNPAMQRVTDRALADLRALRLPISPGTRHREVAAAGVPWFVALFGRDSLIAGMDVAWSFPEYLRGALAALAERQATADDPERDADPGKILHEFRVGELAASGGLPWSPYYGSHDATSLFIVAADQLHAWTGDEAFLLEMRPHLDWALAWLDRYGDRDGDGLQEYATRSSRGFPHQGWKDSPDAIVDVRGHVATPPIALCEHQALTFHAQLAMARLSERWGDSERAGLLRQSASALRERFDEAFWWEEEGTYVLGLDREKRPLRTVASNGGQCLASGIVPPHRTSRVAGRLMADDMFSGWGIRTLSALHPAYDPISYHRGSVWPHDNAAIAAGLARTGHRADATRVAEAILAAAAAMPGGRLPELIGGHQRTDAAPVRPPEANAPQAWAASAVLRLLTMLCGVQPDAPTGKLYADPALPAWLPDLEIRSLRAGTGAVDLRFHGQQMDVMENTTGLEIVHGPAEGGPM